MVNVCQSFDCSPTVGLTESATQMNDSGLPNGFVSTDARALTMHPPQIERHLNKFSYSVNKVQKNGSILESKIHLFLQY